MNILHFSTHLSGGAGIAARRLHEKLLQYHVKSVFAHHPSVNSKGPPLYMPMFSCNGMLRSFLFKLMFKIPIKPSPYYYLHNRPTEYGMFSLPITQYQSSLDMRRLSADVISLHWIADWIDYPSFFSSIPDSFPIVWTLHDMNPFTGGCHHSWECDKFKTGCNSCFQLNERRNPKDISYYFSKLKLDAFGRKNLHVVANSTWLESQACTSRVFRNAKSFQTIHCGLNLEAFKPKNKNFCRKLLDIPESAFVICFGAANVDQKMKGVSLLSEALTAISPSHPVYCLLFGASQIDVMSDSVPQKYVGSISSVDLQTIVYSAADIFVIPSLCEAFGLTSLEAMACGVPVVGFNTGGIPDIITPFENGLLASRGDVLDLADKIIYMIDHPQERHEMGANARHTVAKSFSDSLQAEKYMRLFENILAKS